MRGDANPLTKHLFTTSNSLTQGNDTATITPRENEGKHSCDHRTSGMGDIGFQTIEYARSAVRFRYWNNKGLKDIEVGSFGALRSLIWNSGMRCKSLNNR